MNNVDEVIDNEVINENVDNSEINDEVIDDEPLNDNLTREQIEEKLGFKLTNDPIVNILAQVDFPDNIIRELDECSWNQEKYEKYYKCVDVFIIRQILGAINVCENNIDKTADDRAFNVLMKWFMHKLITDQWWHRRLCYYNRVMGVNTSTTSYWRVNHSPYYIPGFDFTKNMDITPKQFNDEMMYDSDIFAYVDEKNEEVVDEVIGIGINNNINDPIVNNCEVVNDSEIIINNIETNKPKVNKSKKSRKQRRR